MLSFATEAVKASVMLFWPRLRQQQQLRQARADLKSYMNANLIFQSEIFIEINFCFDFTKSFKKCHIF